MKLRKSVVTLAIVLLLIAGIGCANKTSTTPPAPPPVGSINSTDATLYQTLSPIHDFVNSLVSQNNAGTVTLTANQKALLNQLVNDVNIADALYQAWHNAGATGPTTAITTAISRAQSDQNSLNAAIQGGK